MFSTLMKKVVAVLDRIIESTGPWAFGELHSADWRPRSPVSATSVHSHHVET